MRARDSLGVLGAAAASVACCAGLPATLALFGGLTVAGVFAAGLFAVLLVGVAAAFVLRARWRRACDGIRPDRDVGA